MAVLGSAWGDTWGTCVLVLTLIQDRMDTLEALVEDDEFEQFEQGIVWSPPLLLLQAVAFSLQLLLLLCDLLAFPPSAVSPAARLLTH